jgi:hypothetical protein
MSERVLVALALAAGLALLSAYRDAPDLPCARAPASERTAAA